MSGTLITHIDLDGAGCAVLAYCIKQSHRIDNIHFVDYHEIYDKFEFTSSEGNREERLQFKDWSPSHFFLKGRLYVTDISLTPEFVGWGIQNSEEARFFDHHEISLAMSAYAECKVDTTRCGTKLFFDYLKEEDLIDPRVNLKRLDHFVTLVDTYDRFTKNPEYWEDAVNLSRAFWGMLVWYKQDGEKYAPYVRYQLEKMFEPGDRHYLTSHEENLVQSAIESEELEFESALSNLQIRIDGQGNKYLIWHGAKKVSLVCGRLMDAFPDVQYVINVNTYASSRSRKVTGKLSLRSNEHADFNVTTLRGINGHRHAGAGVFDIEFVHKLWFDPSTHLL